MYVNKSCIVFLIVLVIHIGRSDNNDIEKIMVIIYILITYTYTIIVMVII